MLLRLGTTELENGEAVERERRITRWGLGVGVLYRKSENSNKLTGKILIRVQVIISGSTGSDQLCPVSTSIISCPMTPGLLLHALSLTVQSHSTFSCTSAISIFSHRIGQSDKTRSTGGMRGAQCLSRCVSR
jgi:hypothetical protein